MWGSCNIRLRICEGWSTCDAMKRAKEPHPLLLIPVLVTGIQQRRVCGAEEPFRPKDLGWLDSCDKHRNEGSR